MNAYLENMVLTADPGKGYTLLRRGDGTYGSIFPKKIQGEMNQERSKIWLKYQATIT